MLKSLSDSYPNKDINFLLLASSFLLGRDGTKIKLTIDPVCFYLWGNIKKEDSSCNAIFRIVHFLACTPFNEKLFGYLQW